MKTLATKTVNIHDAKTHLSKLLEDVQRGEEVIIAKAGRPIAELKPYTPKRPAIKFGLLKGKLTIPEHFDDPDPEIIKMFEESRLFPDE